MVFTLVKLNGGYIYDRKTGLFKVNAKNENTSAIADHVKSTGHHIK